MAHDNALAVDPATTDPFPSARGWTMMYLAMHDALNAIVPRFQQYAFVDTDPSAHPCGESRIMAGFHHRFSVNVGAHMGNRIAQTIVDTQLTRR